MDIVYETEYLYEILTSTKTKKDEQILLESLENEKIISYFQNEIEIDNKSQIFNIVSLSFYLLKKDSNIDTYLDFFSNQLVNIKNINIGHLDFLSTAIASKLNNDNINLIKEKLNSSNKIEEHLFYIDTLLIYLHRNNITIDTTEILELYKDSKRRYGSDQFNIPKIMHAFIPFNNMDLLDKLLIDNKSIDSFNQRFIKDDIDKVINEKYIVFNENPKYSLNYSPATFTQEYKSVLDNYEVIDFNKTMSKNIGRNDLCPCGSGKKYKKCCLN